MEPGILRNKINFEKKLYTFDQLSQEKDLLDGEVDMLKREINE